MIQETISAGELAAFRRSVYEIFSECFLGTPSRERLDFMGDTEWRQSAAAVLGPEVAALCNEFASAADPNGLAMEHAALFVVPGPRQTFPFETVYRESHLMNGRRAPGRMLGHTALQVQRAYVEWGLPADLGADELPDHAGVELRFMSLLVAAEGRLRGSVDTDCAANVVQAEMHFLENHIMQWFPQWLRCVSGRARRPFYHAAAEVLNNFLNIEKESFDRLTRASLVWAD